MQAFVETVFAARWGGRRGEALRRGGGAVSAALREGAAAAATPCGVEDETAANELLARGVELAVLFVFAEECGRWGTEGGESVDLDEVAVMADYVRTVITEEVCRVASPADARLWLLRTPPLRPAEFFRRCHPFPSVLTTLLLPVLRGDEGMAELLTALLFEGQEGGSAGQGRMAEAEVEDEEDEGGDARMRMRSLFQHPFCGNGASRDALTELLGAQHPALRRLFHVDKGLRYWISRLWYVKKEEEEEGVEEDDAVSEGPPVSSQGEEEEEAEEEDDDDPRTATQQLLMRVNKGLEKTTLVEYVGGCGAFYLPYIEAVVMSGDPGVVESLVTLVADDAAAGSFLRHLSERCFACGVGGSGGGGEAAAPPPPPGLSVKHLVYFTEGLLLFATPAFWESLLPELERDAAAHTRRVEAAGGEGAGGGGGEGVPPLSSLLGTLRRVRKADAQAALLRERTSPGLAEVILQESGEEEDEEEEDEEDEEEDEEDEAGAVDAEDAGVSAGDEGETPAGHAEAGVVAAVVAAEETPADAERGRTAGGGTPQEGHEAAPAASAAAAAAAAAALLLSEEQEGVDGGGENWGEVAQESRGHGPAAEEGGRTSPVDAATTTTTSPDDEDPSSHLDVGGDASPPPPPPPPPSLHHRRRPESMRSVRPGGGAAAAAMPTPLLVTTERAASASERCVARLRSGRSDKLHAELQHQLVWVRRAELLRSATESRRRSAFEKGRQQRRGVRRRFEQICSTRERRAQQEVQQWQQHEADAAAQRERLRLREEQRALLLQRTSASSSAAAAASSAVVPAAVRVRCSAEAAARQRVAAYRRERGGLLDGAGSGGGGGGGGVDSPQRQLLFDASGGGGGCGGGSEMWTDRVSRGRKLQPAEMRASAERLNRTPLSWAPATPAAAQQQQQAPVVACAPPGKQQHRTSQMTAEAAAAAERRRRKLLGGAYLTRSREEHRALEKQRDGVRTEALRALRTQHLKPLDRVAEVGMVQRLSSPVKVYDRHTMTMMPRAG